jgi:hypothetical protein
VAVGVVLGFGAVVDRWVAGIVAEGFDYEWYVGTGVMRE